MEEMSLEETKRIINRIFNQANAGVCEIDTTDSQYTGPWKFYTKFYAKVGGIILKNGEDLFAKHNKQKEITEDDFVTPIFQIPDAEIFATLVDDYLAVAEKFFISDKARFAFYDDTFKEKLILDLLVNSTNFDRHNLFSYIKTRTQMIETDLNCSSFLLDENGEFKTKALFAKNPSLLEAPYRFTPFFVDETNNTFQLPTITFAVINDTLYIFSIQAKKQKQTNPLAKKLDRHFRKVNKDINSEDIIAQVSPNALVSLAMFLSILQKEGMKNVVAPNFMPLRYKTNLAGDLNHFNVKKEGIAGEKTVEEIYEKHDRQQFSITNKFAYTLMRYCHHFDGCKIHYDDIREQIQISLSKNNHPQDNLIQEVDKLCDKTLGLRENEKQK